MFQVGGLVCKLQGSVFTGPRIFSTTTSQFPGLTGFILEVPEGLDIRC